MAALNDPGHETAPKNGDGQDFFIVDNYPGGELYRYLLKKMCSIFNFLTCVMSAIGGKYE